MLKAAAALTVSALTHAARVLPPEAASAATLTPDRDAATPAPGRPIGYVFNTGTRDVTLFDPVTRQVLETKPLGAVVRWLSTEQRFWDGKQIWTYDFPDDAVQALAIAPDSVTVARTLPTGGKGPAHSLMLTPDGTTAWLNEAGDNALVALDLATGEVQERISTGAFP